jgi:hypothetical protein
MGALPSNVQHIDGHRNPSGPAPRRLGGEVVDVKYDMPFE